MPPRSVTSAQGRTTARSGNFSQGFGRPSGEDRPDDRPPSGMSPGRAQAQFGTPALAGYTPEVAQSFVNQLQKDPSGKIAQALGPAGTADALATQANIQAQQAYQSATLQQLQQDLRDIERRRASTMFPGSLGFFQDLNLKNLANQISGAGLTTAALTPTQLASMQQRVIRDAAGRVIGYRDARGVLTAGRDPQQEEEERLAQRGQGGMDARPMYTAPDPQTGECDPGYIFDEDLQACRLDTGVSASVDFGADVPTYARMGLLDVAPTGLLEFGQRFGTSPGDFGAANLAFRRATGTRPSYFQAPPKLDGYTLLS